MAVHRLREARQARGRKADDWAGFALLTSAVIVRSITIRARARKLTPEDLSGGSFTVSNLGMYGIRQFTAVIDPPQAAILVAGEAVRHSVVRGDQVTIAATMTLTLVIDHRAVDAPLPPRFLTDLGELIEQPLDIVP